MGNPRCIRNSLSIISTWTSWKEHREGQNFHHTIIWETNVGQTISSARPGLRRRGQYLLWTGRSSVVKRGQALMLSPHGAGSRDEAVGAHKHFSPSGILALVPVISKAHIYQQAERQRDFGGHTAIQRKSLLWVLWMPFWPSLPRWPSCTGVPAEAELPLQAPTFRGKWTMQLPPFALRRVKEVGIITGHLPCTSIVLKVTHYQGRNRQGAVILRAFWLTIQQPFERQNVVLPLCLCENVRTYQCLRWSQTNNTSYYTILIKEEY